MSDLCDQCAHQPTCGTAWVSFKRRSWCEEFEPRVEASSPECPLCERRGEYLELQRHHLRTRKLDKDATEAICRECHKTIHGLFNHHELRDVHRGLDTLEGLRADPGFARALTHIKKLPPGMFMRMKQRRRR